MGLGDMIEVNDFSFCRDHGSEYCGLCTCDYRDVNNHTIEDHPAIMHLNEESMYFCIGNRHPINVFEKGATHCGSGRYECTAHKVVDCKGCFNWVGFICAEAREAERNESWLRKREKYLNKVDP